MNFDLIIMIHIASAIVCVGASFFFSMSVFPSLSQIPNERMIVRTTIRIMFRYLKVTFVASLLLLATGVFLALETKVYETNPILKTILYTKGYIWAFMTIAYFYAYNKTKMAKRICFKGDSLLAVENLKVIANYVFVLNFILGLIAIYFGIMLRG
jgi:uncharacterized membrane protein